MDGNRDQAAEMADIIQAFVGQSSKGSTFRRGIIQSVSGRRANVRIDGNSVATQSVLCLGSYTPVVGHKVLLVSIGDTGANLIILGSING